MDNGFPSSLMMDVFSGEILRGIIALKMQGEDTLHASKAIQIVQADPQACSSSLAETFVAITQR